MRSWLRFSISLVYPAATMTAPARINADVLLWARERARLTIEQLAKGVHAKPEQVMAWEVGEAFPTFRQAQHLAATAHVPFGFLFLPKPPQEKLPLPDLRTVGGEAVSEPSVDLLDTVRAVLQKQAWYIEYLKESGHAPLAFVGSHSLQSPVRSVVADMVRVLKIGEGTRHGSWEDYQRSLIAAADNAGILVMRSGMVGNNTHRKLDVAEFRGFAVADKWAPVVFINSADAPSARLFTFVHELAHLWIGSSGISNQSTTTSRREEQFCNAVAGEFLVPEHSFLDLWDGALDWRANVARLPGIYHVSKLVIARRALDLGFIDAQTHRDFYLQELEAYRRGKKSGGSSYRTAKAKNGQRFSLAILSEALSGRMLLRDAGRLLGVQPAKIGVYAKEFKL
ncbi:MAG: XRE family transcriptional regulator [Sulfuricellaceae bacterium]|nr:XRE family transcriptional regulator [Sulfuricellaceae bacterium]